METRSDLEERTDTSVCPYGSGSGTRDTAQQFQQCRFAGTVLADDADDVALLHLEIDVTESPDVFGVTLRSTVIGFADLEIGILFAEDVGYPEAADIVR